MKTENAFYADLKAAQISRACPKVCGIECQTYYLPAKVPTGDICVVQRGQNDLLLFLIGAAARHGVEAYVASLYLERCFVDCLRLMTSTNYIMQRLQESVLDLSFMKHAFSLCVGTVEPQTGTVCCTIAGDFVLIQDSAEKLLPITPVARKETFGLNHGNKYEYHEIVLLPGEYLTVIASSKVLSGRKSSLMESSSDATGGFGAALTEKTTGDFLEFLRDSDGAGLPPAQSDNARASLEMTAGVFKRWSASKSGELVDYSTTMVRFGAYSQQQRVTLKYELGFNDGAPLYIQYLSSYGEIDTVSGRILKDMDEAGFSDEMIRNMKLTITELITNAINHGNKEDLSKTVTVGHRIEPERISVSVLDEGVGFDPSAVPDPTLPENLTKDHGRGLYIVRQYIDEISFNRMGNRILIRKYRKAGNRR